MHLVLLVALAADPVSGFLSTYCTACHGPAAQMAGKRFDQAPLSSAAVEGIVRRLESSTMPPPGARQPAASDRQAALAALRAQLAAARPAEPVLLRRLNRREYLHTVAGLTGIDMAMFDPTSRFPRDQQDGHADNIGETLVTSGYLLEQYMDAARQVLAKALPAQPPPAPRTWVFKDRFRQQPELDGARTRNNLLQYMTLFEHPRTPHHEGAFAPLRDFADGVPYDGVYKVRVQVEALHRKNPYNPALFGMDPEAPFRFGVVAGNARAGHLHHSQPIEPLLAETVLEDGGPYWLEFRVPLDAGYQPRFTFPNGMNNVRTVFSQFARRFPQFLPEDQRDVAPGIVPGRIAMMKYAPLPHIRIHQVEIEGPFDAPPVSPSRQLLYGGKPFAPSRTREILAAFAARAYRRPATAEEVERLVALAGKRAAAGSTPEQALQEAMAAVLCSPAFLYLDTTQEKGRLNAYALASRLSYFLWSTMPDEPLLAKARSGALLTDAGLSGELRRMLADKRSDRFVHGFLDGWLNLRALGDMPPDRDAFGAYYWDDLQAAMKTETRMLFRHLVDANGPVMDLLTARYTFLNKPLARLYGMAEGIDSRGGHTFRKVELPADGRRAGLLGHGSVLTVSANGIETSPVTRGVWVLENILGAPPPPPPDDVPALEPDIRGAKTVRDLLAKHRSDPSCMSCHKSIDPPGFALESFDPIGRWRDRYPNKAPIDASGELATGEKFNGIAGLRALLARDETGFRRVVAEQLLRYATGRKPTPADRALASALAARHARMGDMLAAIVLSDGFRKQ